MRGAFRIFIDENTRRGEKGGREGRGHSTYFISPHTPVGRSKLASDGQLSGSLVSQLEQRRRRTRGHGPHGRTVAICSACLNDFQSAVRIQRSQTMRDIFSPGSARSNRLPLSTGGGGGSGAAADGGGEITGGAARRLLYLNSAQKEAPSRLNAH